jgi:hypothetical protein
MLRKACLPPLWVVSVSKATWSVRMEGMPLVLGNMKMAKVALSRVPTLPMVLQIPVGIPLRHITIRHHVITGIITMGIGNLACLVVCWGILMRMYKVYKRFHELPMHCNVL